MNENQNLKTTGEFRMKRTLATLVLAFFFCTQAFAGIQAFDLNSTLLGNFSSIKCTSGLSCSTNGGQLSITVAGVSASAGQMTRYIGWQPPTLSSGTSTTASATTLYLSQIFIPANAVLTGIAVNNAATVGTNKYVVALFNASGIPVANSALAGVTTSGASAFQSVPFTATYSVTGPAVYWIGLYVNGATDTFYSIPAVGAANGLAGSVAGQTFGTVTSVVLPTTFTAGLGPVAFTY